MKDWKLQINAADIWAKGHNKEIEVSQFVKLLYERLISYSKKVKDIFGEEVLYEFDIKAEELNDCDFESYDDFDFWLSDFYDLCDQEKIWLNTHSMTETTTK